MNLKLSAGCFPANLSGEQSFPLSIRFYPYAGLRSTIRQRRGRVRIRLSDLLEDAPSEVLEAIVTILLHKLHRQPIPSHARKVYQHYVSQPEFEKRIEEVRRLRGHKEVYHPKGRVFDLRPLFESLNREYFEGKLEIDLLGWSRRRARTRLGHWDSAHRAIVLNRRLDHPLVPEYVVTYILYHEMLHAHLGIENCGGQRRVHHRRFRELEQRHPDYRRARNFIDREMS